VSILLDFKIIATFKVTEIKSKGRRKLLRDSILCGEIRIMLNILIKINSNNNLKIAEFCILLI
jgi:hypothetical protein